MSTSSPTVGLLGLGIMGSAMSPHLLAAGFEVVGFDVSSAQLAAFAAMGGTPAASPRAVAQRADIVISVLPSVKALDEVVSGPDGLLAAGRSGQILIEASTLPLEDKERVRAAAAPRLTVLDCPLSGTGAQAVAKDLLVYASGDSAAIARCVPVFNGFARAHHDLGAFGNGSKMKFVANLLVSIHNVAAAEAFVLGMKAGLDAEAIYQVVGDGAGGSRMFTVRGPLMVERCVRARDHEGGDLAEGHEDHLRFRNRPGLPDAPARRLCFGLHRSDGPGPRRAGHRRGLRRAGGTRSAGTPRTSTVRVT